jgi:hypothetical protein
VMIHSRSCSNMNIQGIKMGAWCTYFWLQDLTSPSIGYMFQGSARMNPKCEHHAQMPLSQYTWGLVRRKKKKKHNHTI